MEELAIYIHKAVYERLVDYKVTIFLCGAGAQTGESVRTKIDTELRNSWYWFKYDIFYPEDLFEELLVGTGHQDLISLENILAESVDAVVLIVESWGAVAELGSFSSNADLRKKLVVIVDRKYRKSRSFINYGPLRLMKDKKEGEIVYGDFSKPEELIPPMRKAVTSVKNKTKKSLGIQNIVQTHHYVLSCIYLLEPISRDLLCELVRHASEQEQRKAEALTVSALSILTKRKEIELHSDGYRLTSEGAEKFLNLGKRGKTRYTYDIHEMDSIRVKVLNSRLRGKKVPF